MLEIKYYLNSFNFKKKQASQNSQNSLGSSIYLILFPKTTTAKILARPTDTGLIK